MFVITPSDKLYMKRFVRHSKGKIIRRFRNAMDIYQSRYHAIQRFTYTRPLAIIKTKQNKTRTNMKAKLITNIYLPTLLFLFSVNLNAQIETEKTKVLILGTHHLNQIKNFQPKMLDNLIIKLDSLEFDAVCIESMPGQLLYDIKSREDSAFIYIIEHMARTRLAWADSMQVKLGFGFLESEKNAESLLSKDYLSDTERVQLIEYLIASTDIYSATLQYKLIKDNSVFNGSNLGQHIIDKLQQFSEGLNANTSQVSDKIFLIIKNYLKILAILLFIKR